MVCLAHIYKTEEKNFNGEDSSLYHRGREDVGTTEMAQLVKALATQPEVLIVIFESHMVDREQKIVL